MRRRAGLAWVGVAALAVAMGARPARAQSEPAGAPPPPPPPGGAPQGGWVWAGAPLPDPVIEGWSPGERIPPGYQPAHRGSKPIVIAAVAIFASVYASNVVGVVGNAVGGGPGLESWLAVPAVGPLVLMAQTTNPLGNVVLGLDALAQLSAITMFVYGLATPVHTLVYEGRGVAIAAVPTAGAGRAGFGLVGRF